MDVRMPDGTIIQNVPEGTTQSDLQRKLQAYQGPQAPSEPTAGSRAMAGLGGFNTGIAGLAGLPMDTIKDIANLGMTGYGAAKNFFTGRNDSPPVIESIPGGHQTFESLMNKGGIATQNPNPQDPLSRGLHTGGTVLGGSIGSRPVPALLAAIGGGAASEIDPRLTAVGAMAPGAARAGFGAAMRSANPGAAANLKMFEEAGVQPTVGMTASHSLYAGIENLLSKFPGGRGVMESVRDKIQSSLGLKTKTGVSAEDAGRAIERGITGKGGFLETTKARWQELENRVAAKVPKNTTVAPTETSRALDELTAPVQGAEKSTAGLVNPKLAKMKEDLQADLAANNGVLPFEALRALRTRVGSMLENAIVSGVQAGEAKRLYGALSKDLEAAAIKGGAGPEFARQNAYYTARMGRIERTLERVLGTDKHPEDIFKAFYPTDATQSSKVQQVMRSLPPDERRVVTNAVVDRLGRATPGKQNELGDVFSSETFLTNYTKLSPKAKAVLFPDPKMAADLDSIAAASAKMRHGNTPFVNNSGTAGSFAAYGVYSSPMVALGTGNPAPMVAAGLSVGGAYATARLLTHPPFVRWMANGPKKLTPQAVASHMARLAVIANRTNDEALKEDMSDYITKMNGEQ